MVPSWKVSLHGVGGKWHSFLKGTNQGGLPWQYQMVIWDLEDDVLHSHRILGLHICKELSAEEKSKPRDWRRGGGAAGGCWLLFVLNGAVDHHGWCLLLGRCHGLSYCEDEKAGSPDGLWGHCWCSSLSVGVSAGHGQRCSLWGAY